MPTIAERWIQEGLEKGRKEGLEQGLQQGLVQGLYKAIELGLELRFGTDGLVILPEIYRIEDAHLLRAISEALKNVKSPDELRRLYQSHS